MSNVVPDFMATRYYGLEASSSKYLSASQQNVSYTFVIFATEDSDAFMSIFDANR